MVMFFENRNGYPYTYASVKPSPRRYEKNFLKKSKKTLDKKKRLYYIIGVPSTKGYTFFEKLHFYRLEKFLQKFF